MTQQDEAANEAAWQRLKKYNPFVVGLDQREGPKGFYLQFFDGESGLVSEPITDFDGYRGERDYPFFAPALVLVAATILLPLAFLYWRGAWPWYAYAIMIGSYIASAMLLSVLVAFHLTNLRNEYINANNKILVQNFVIRAQGVKSIIHMFKRMLRWRRFMRYAMNFGGFLLLLDFVLTIFIWYRAPKWFHPNQMMEAAAILQFAIGAMALRLFEVARGRYTRGVDPTLALVLMVEEIGGQLLASRQMRIVNS
ncbi:MAG TPA: hypothetical protein VGG48_02285 [Rhizomicrobium sp.]|jgi:hypothetical protein